MTFTSGQYGPEAIVDSAGNALIGAAVTVPGGYTKVLDAFGNLTVTGPPSDSVSITVTPVGGSAATRTIRVQPLVTETADVASVAANTTAIAGKLDASAAAGSYQPLDSDLTALAGLDASTAGVSATDGAGWIKKTYAQLKTSLSLVKADVGLGNVDNTADTAKPVSTAQAAADALAVPKSLYDANTILAATTDDTPVALTVAASTLVGRKATGGIAALTAAEVTALGVGSSLYPVRQVFPSGLYVGSLNGGSVNDAAVTLGKMIASQLVIPYGSVSFVSIGVYVQVSGVGATVRLGVYDADPTTGMPANLVFDAGTISGASTGQQYATISQTLNAGVYWLVACGQGAATCNLKQTGTGIAPGGASTADQIHTAVGADGVASTVTTNTGALPSTFGPASASLVRPHRVALKVA